MIFRRNFMILVKFRENTRKFDEKSRNRERHIATRASRNGHSKNGHTVDATVELRLRKDCASKIGNSAAILKN